MGWLDITDDLTDFAIRELKVGQVLIFDFEGSPVHLKIMRKQHGKVWARKNYMYLPEEVEVTDKNKINKI